MLLIQGDDDRNVQLRADGRAVQLLRQRDVYHELIVFPDDIHESLLHARYLQVFNRLEEFIGRLPEGLAGAIDGRRPIGCGASG